jgi:hypothetical protein
VSISFDGNTAIIGGPMDNGGIGAAWIFTRSGTTWTQQGGKLVGSGFVGASLQGSSVAISADGNTAIIGGPGDNVNTGAAWVFTRSGGVWTQQGGKLVGTGAIGNAAQGQGVALSSDGNTAIVGGPGDSANAGAAWVFTRNAGTWTQQGPKILGAGAAGSALQGSSVSLSYDGNTAIIGGPGDNLNTGATWAFTRFGGVWIQFGNKLAAAGAQAGDRVGSSVSLSGDSLTAAIGAPGTLTCCAGSANFINGAFYVFVREGVEIPATTTSGLLFLAVVLAVCGVIAIRRL